MIHLKYEKLLGITKSTYPFRGTKEYPIHDRRHGHKRFEVVEVEKSDGTKDVEFHIYYGYTYDTKTVSKEEYTAAIKQHAKTGWPKTYTGYHNDKNEISYHLSTRTRAKVGIVRSDNTFEFTNLPYFHQGVAMFLSNWLQRVWASTRQGGMILFDRTSRNMHPVFAGLRINLDTFQPHESCNYVLYKKVVNRSRGHAARKKYEKQMRVARAMFSAMNKETMLSQMKDILEEVRNTEESNRHYGLTYIQKEALASYVLENIHDDPVGAIMARMMVDNTFFIRQSLNGYSGYAAETAPVTYFELAKINVLRDIYVATDAVDEEAIPMGGHIPSSRWPFKIMLDGKQVKQFK